MTGRVGTGTDRARGSVKKLPSGALRVRVYAGVDPFTGRRHYLAETVEPGRDARKEAEAIRARLLQEVAQRRAPMTSATVDELLEKYLDGFAGSPTTLDLYRTHVRNHISPSLGHIKAGRLNAETLDSFYGVLRRCRSRCSGRGRTIDHGVSGDHECNEKCRPHRCRPLAPTTIRQIHFILSGAYKRAVRWGWVAENPTAKAEPPSASKPNPQPPTAAEAARIVTASWREPDWGTLVWIAMTTGIRRGELCALRRSSVDLTEGRETLWLRRAIRREPGAGWGEGDLKTHQQRRIALDAATVSIVQEHIERCAARAAALRMSWPADAFLFSFDPDGRTFPTPDGVTQRYDRMVTRLGIDTTFHKLRHYSATELIAAGVDPRTVAGRLGHGGGGTTTLRTYTAWVSESDQRAARGLGAGMPQRPPELDEAAQAREDPRHPYQVVAASVALRIDAGSLAPGAPAPVASELVVEHGVSLATAKRALVLLQEWGHIGRWNRTALVVATPPEPPAEPVLPKPPIAADDAGGLLNFVLRRRGEILARFSSVADPNSAVELHEMLCDAVQRAGGGDVAEYELDVARPGDRDPLMTFVASRRRKP